MEKSFDNLKNAACNKPSIKIPDPEKPFIVENDASGVAVGAVLKQVGEDGEVPVSFYSVGLTKSERNYSTYERELYAVVKACEAFRVFLLANPFILRTDHKALAALFSSKNMTSRIVKWIMRLQECPFTIQYLSGTDNLVADALSRIPWPFQSIECQSSKEIVKDDDVTWICKDMIDSDEHFLSIILPALVNSSPTLPIARIRQEQQDDRELYEIYSWKFLIKNLVKIR